MALKLLMKCALDRNVSRIHIFGDSSLVINWMARTSLLQNVGLRPLGDNLKEISSSFDFISYTHVFREHNTVADTLSKEGQFLSEGHMTLIEFGEGSSVVTTQSLKHSDYMFCICFFLYFWEAFMLYNYMFWIKTIWLTISYIKIFCGDSCKIEKKISSLSLLGILMDQKNS
jgi:hypothetical protein